ncbi:hypothetical protein Hanom_Chr10g00917641 [Helianthus anomalus]
MNDCEFGLYFSLGYCFHFHGQFCFLVSSKIYESRLCCNCWNESLKHIRIQNFFISISKSVIMLFFIFLCGKSIMISAPFQHSLTLCVEK